MAIAITYKEARLYQILAQPNVLSNENVGSIYEVATENNLEAVGKVCLNYLSKYFNTIVRDQNVVSKWSATFVKDLISQFEAGKSKHQIITNSTLSYWPQISLVELARHVVAGTQSWHDRTRKQSRAAIVAKH